jgi:hypothetical protein
VTRTQKQGRDLGHKKPALIFQKDFFHFVKTLRFFSVGRGPLFTEHKSPPGIFEKQTHAFFKNSKCPNYFLQVLNHDTQLVPAAYHSNFILFFKIQKYQDLH